MPQHVGYNAIHIKNVPQGTGFNRTTQRLNYNDLSRQPLATEKRLVIQQGRKLSDLNTSAMFGE